MAAGLGACLIIGAPSAGFAPFAWFQYPHCETPKPSRILESGRRIGLRRLVLIALIVWNCAAESLKECRTVFVQPMPESLDHFLTAEISRWGAMEVVETKEKADCVASFGREANRIAARLRLGSTAPAKNASGAENIEDRLPVHFNGFGYTNSATIEVVHRASSFLVWSDSQTDTWSLAGGPKTLARKLVGQLKRDYKMEK